jgi:tRNA(Ile2) C34 agmatinyltransferase TiaS
MLFIGLDDTDNQESRGTGHLAREIACSLAADYAVLGVVRHQLLFDPRVPFTKHNSSKTVILDVNGSVAPEVILERVRPLMLADFQVGSDPGLCVACMPPANVIEFGFRAKREFLVQSQARDLAAALGIPLVGLGGSEDGVIGALAAVGLAASGEDGRYVMVGGARELSGLQPVSGLVAAGITRVETAQGQPVWEGLVLCDKLRPARRGGCPVAVVEWGGEHWLPLRLD